MHELSIAQELLRLCQARLEAGQRLQYVRIAVGELASVEPDLLRFAWQAVTAGTPHATAVLDVAWCPARQRCDACGEIAERQPGSWLRLCPQCGQALRVEGGDQLDLLTLTPAATELKEVTP
ncbi:MAG: hydrogenase maturation nickel metallochaperone HypA [Planctomycetota bacterium]